MRSEWYQIRDCSDKSKICRPFGAPAPLRCVGPHGAWRFSLICFSCVVCMMDFESFIMLDDSLALKSLSEPFSIDSNCFHPLYIYTHDLKLFRVLPLKKFMLEASSVLGVLVQGLRSNLWGLACPFYCTGPSVSLALSFFLLGFLCGCGLCAWFLLRWHCPVAFLHTPSCCISPICGSRGQPSCCSSGPLAWATTAPTLRSPWKLAASGSLCLGLCPIPVGLSATCSVSWPLHWIFWGLSSFSACPSHLRALGSKLVGASLSGAGRIDRAWTAGRWARAVSDSRVHSPNRTPPLDLRSRFYSVVRADGLDRPTIFCSPTSYRRAIGSLENSSSISQSFRASPVSQFLAAGFAESETKVLPWGNSQWRQLPQKRRDWAWKL